MAVGEWDERQLCPDGSCVGVIGDNGHCRVCNRVATNWGNERDRGLRANSAAETPVVADDELGPDEEWDDEDDEDGDESEDDEDEEEDEEAAKLAELDPSTPSLIGAPAEWNKRILCSDGACIGVIGTDGRCKVCGKPAKRKTLASATGASADIDHDSGQLENDADDDEDATASDDDDDDDEGEDEDDEDGDDEDDDDEDEESADDDKRSAAAAGERTGAGSSAGAAATTAAVDAELLAAANDMAAALPHEADFDRKLCPDGACVGVIGADGHCKICKKARDWKETA
jgi:hypothetical protein